MRRLPYLWFWFFFILVFALAHPSSPISLAQTVPPPTQVAYLPLVLRILPTATSTPTETPIPTETPTPTPTDPGDIRPPELTTWSFAPASVSTANSDQTIDFTARLTDNMSGLHHAIAWFYGPRGQQVYVWFRFPYELASGTAQNGLYKSKMTVPRFSASGEWKLNYIVMYDRTDNIDFLYPRDLAPMGLPFSFQVTN